MVRISMKAFEIVDTWKARRDCWPGGTGRNYPLPVESVPLWVEVGVMPFYRSTFCISCRCRKGRYRSGLLWRRSVPALELRLGQARFDIAVAAADGADGARFRELPPRGARAE